MNENKLWELIDKSVEKFMPGSDDQYEWIAEQLKKLTIEEIVQFENVLNELKAKAYTFPVLMANFIIQSYVSDDVFEDFCLWLISNGKSRFYAAIADLESIAEWRVEKFTLEETIGEGLLFVAEEAYHDITGKEDFNEHVEIIPCPDIVEEWPDTPAGFQKKMPKLFEKYWNPEQIKLMHQRD